MEEAKPLGPVAVGTMAPQTSVQMLARRVLNLKASQLKLVLQRDGHIRFLLFFLLRIDDRVIPRNTE